MLQIVTRSIRRERIIVAVERTAKTVSFILLLKGAAGFAVLALALFGVTVPWFGYEATNFGGGLAATAGAIFGTILALRA